MFLPTIMGSSPRPSFADSTRVFSLFSFSRRPATSLATSSPCESRSPFRVRRSSPLWSISRICRLSSVARFLRMCTSRTCLVVASMRGGPAKVTPSKWCSSPVCWSSASSRPRRMTRLSISMLRFLDSSVSAAYSSSLRPTSARWKCMSLTSSSYDVCAVAEKKVDFRVVDSRFVSTGRAHELARFHRRPENAERLTIDVLRVTGQSRAVDLVLASVDLSPCRLRLIRGNKLVVKRLTSLYAVAQPRHRLDRQLVRFGAPVRGPPFAQLLHLSLLRLFGLHLRLLDVRRKLLHLRLSPLVKVLMLATLPLIVSRVGEVGHDLRRGGHLRNPFLPGLRALLFQRLPLHTLHLLGNAYVL
mmetsp:Transcript_42935/g.115639  ORF Transcript_42935/g.115639 Transcript_42935/m.115639 type:complete len:358 (-) Transcript_42935:747-1820(-)